MNIEPRLARLEIVVAYNTIILSGLAGIKFLIWLGLI